MKRPLTWGAVGIFCLGAFVIALNWFAWVFVTWVMWCYSVADMMPFNTSLAFEQPDFLTYTAFWFMVSIGLKALAKVWRTK